MIAPAAGGLLVVSVDVLPDDRKRTAAVPDVMEARIDAGRSLHPRPGPAQRGGECAVAGGVGAQRGPLRSWIVHLGVSIAADFLCSYNLSLPNAARRTLIASGAAGAVAASFNTPIAGVLFAQEVILGHFAVEKLRTPLLASVTATILLSQAWLAPPLLLLCPTYQITSYLEVPGLRASRHRRRRGGGETSRSTPRHRSGSPEMPNGRRSAAWQQAGPAIRIIAHPGFLQSARCRLLHHRCGAQGSAADRAHVHPAGRQDRGDPPSGLRPHASAAASPRRRSIPPLDRGRLRPASWPTWFRTSGQPGCARHPRHGRGHRGRARFSPHRPR